MDDKPGNEVLYEEIADHIALVTLNRPEKRNAVNAAIAQGLDAAVKRAEADTNIRVVILTSSHESVFCAGADLSEVAGGNARTLLYTPDGGFAGFDHQKRRKPWIAAGRGSILAGGLEICLACDMIVVAEGSKLGLPEVKRSLIAGAGGVERLPKVIPRAIAIEMIATGNPIDAGRAYEIGLVNQAHLKRAQESESRDQPRERPPSILKLTEEDWLAKYRKEGRPLPDGSTSE